jgi:Mg/Co/Ni transporter MgtE
MLSSESVIERSINSDDDIFNETLDLSLVEIDDAPISITTSTPLLKIHQLFGVMNVTEIYVTNCATLIGVITLDELASVIKN